MDTNETLVWPENTPVAFMATNNRWLMRQKRKYRTGDWNNAFAAVATAWKPETCFLVKPVDPEGRPHLITISEFGTDPKDQKLSLRCDCDSRAPTKTRVVFAGDVSDSAQFTYFVIDRDDEGRFRIALKCKHGKFLQYRSAVKAMAPRVELLTDQAIALTVAEPVSSRTITDIKYRENEAEDPLMLEPAVDYWSTVVNPSDGEVTKEFVFTHQKETIGTWNNEIGVSLSVGASFEAKVPFASAEFHWELTAEARRSWGGSEGETQTVEDSTTIVVPAHSKLDVHVLVSRRRQDIPFTYTVKRRGLDGELLKDAQDRGVYRAIETLGTKVEIGSVTALTADLMPDLVASGTLA